MPSHRRVHTDTSDFSFFAINQLESQLDRRSLFSTPGFTSPGNGTPRDKMFEMHSAQK